MRTVGGMSMISPALVCRERGARREPAAALRLGAVRHGLLALRHAPDEEARVEATRVLPRRDPAREVVEGSGRGPQIMRLEERAELLARVQPPAQRRELGRERSIEDAPVPLREKNPHLLEQLAHRGHPVRQCVGRAVTLLRRRPGLLRRQRRARHGVIAGIDHAARKCVHTGEGHAPVTLEHQDRERGVTGALARAAASGCSTGAAEHPARRAKCSGCHGIVKGHGWHRGDLTRPASAHMNTVLPAMIDVRNVSRLYHRGVDLVHALEHVSLHDPDGALRRADGTVGLRASRRCSTWSPGSTGPTAARSSSPGRRSPTSTRTSSPRGARATSG